MLLEFSLDAYYPGNGGNGRRAPPACGEDNATRGVLPNSQHIRVAGQKLLWHRSRTTAAERRDYRYFHDIPSLNSVGATSLSTA